MWQVSMHLPMSSQVRKNCSFIAGEDPCRERKRPMKIYVDYDDCLCETARAFTRIAEALFGKKVPYEEVRYFSLKDSFDLNEKEYKELMDYGHRPEVLLSYEETPGASRVLNEWIDLGHEVFVITGRPHSSLEPSVKWLEEHSLSRVKLFFLDKYGRDMFLTKGDYDLSIEDYYRMKFDFAVEDSPMAFRFLEHLPDLRVLVYDRPWNREASFPGKNFIRCPDWDRIRLLVAEKSAEQEENER